MKTFSSRVYEQFKNIVFQFKSPEQFMNIVFQFKSPDQNQQDSTGAL